MIDKQTFNHPSLYAIGALLMLTLGVAWLNISINWFDGSDIVLSTLSIIATVGGILGIIQSIRAMKASLLHMTHRQRQQMGASMYLISMFFHYSNGYSFDPNATFLISGGHNSDLNLVWIVMHGITIVLSLIFFLSTGSFKN